MCAVRPILLCLASNHPTSNREAGVYRGNFFRNVFCHLPHTSQAETCALLHPIPVSFFVVQEAGGTNRSRPLQHREPRGEVAWMRSHFTSQSLIFARRRSASTRTRSALSLSSLQQTPRPRSLTFCPVSPPQTSNDNDDNKQANKQTNNRPGQVPPDGRPAPLRGHLLGPDLRRVQQAHRGGGLRSLPRRDRRPLQANNSLSCFLSFLPACSKVWLSGAGLVEVLKSMGDRASVVVCS